MPIRSSSTSARCGAAHVPGMMAQRGKAFDKAALDRIPPPSKLWTFVKWLIPAFLVFGLVWGAFHSEKVSAQDVIMALVLSDPHAIDNGMWAYGYLRTRGNTIEAGTSEIQRNIIGHFVLGLPKSY